MAVKRLKVCNMTKLRLFHSFWYLLVEFLLIKLEKKETNAIKYPLETPFRPPCK